MWLCVKPMNLILCEKVHHNFKIQIAFIHIDNGDVKICQLSRNLLDIANEIYCSKWFLLLETKPPAIAVTLGIHYRCKPHKIPKFAFV